MVGSETRAFWQGRWGYKESVAFSVGLIATGLLLQLLIGGVGGVLFTFPANIILGLAYLFLLITIHLTAGRTRLVLWMASSPTAVTLMLTLGMLVVLMGLTPQRNIQDMPVSGIIGKIGLDALIQTWYFAFIFLFLLTSLGLTTLQRTIPFKRSNIGFILNHLGLWLTLFAGVLGSGDVARLTMSIKEGKVEWRASDSQGIIYEMPIAVELHDFVMEEYPANLYLIDTRSGEPLPLSKPQHIASEDSLSAGFLGNWRIDVVKKLNSAAAVTADKYEQYFAQGACQAAYIKASDSIKGKYKEGWVSSGSFIFPHKALYLNDTTGVLMGIPEPRKFRSLVTIYTKNGIRADTAIEVNRSVHINGWTIYQLGYDDKMGRWSTLSTLEFVRDPWIPVVYTGLAMLLAGAVYMFWIAGRKRKLKIDVE